MPNRNYEFEDREHRAIRHFSIGFGAFGTGVLAIQAADLLSGSQLDADALATAAVAVTAAAEFAGLNSEHAGRRKVAAVAMGVTVLSVFGMAAQTIT